MLNKVELDRLYQQYRGGNCEVWMRPGLLAGLLAGDDRGAIIEWLMWDDRNGCFSDEDRQDEGFPPLSLDEAKELLELLLRECL